MSTTSIEWATHVLNAFTGCDRVSAGCAFCYAIPTAAANQRKELGRARRMAELDKPPPVMRYQADGDPKTSGPGFGFTVHWDKIASPPPIPAGARVFVNSMSDVFHEQAPLEAIAALWELFASRPDVTWMVLTKREDRMRDAMLWLSHSDDAPALSEWPLPNVWLGVTIENRSFVHRADVLRKTPAAVRFISAEPLLGPLVADFSEELGDYGTRHGGEWLWPDGSVADGPGLDLTGIHWLIAGGESGHHLRQKPYRFLVDGAGEPRVDREQWIRDLRDTALASGTRFFFKQWGGRTPKTGGRDLDGRTWDEFPLVAERTPTAASGGPS